MTATISIAMATFNGVDHVRAQLESLSAQDRLPDELIVCDDSSTDGTLAIVTDFSRTAPFRVAVVENGARLGYNGNFAKAIGLCRSDLIFICDQDDIWLPNKIDTIADRMDNEPAILAAINDQVIATADAVPTVATVLGNVRRLGFPDTHFIPGCCTAFRRSLLDIADPFPGDPMPYDHWINIIADLLGARAIHEEPLQLYRRHDSNASGSDWARERPTDWTLAATARRGNPRAAFAVKLHSLDILAGRFAEREAAIANLGFGDRSARARALVANERADYQARLDVLAFSRMRRLPNIAGLLARGTYRRFHGYKSALKDLLS